MLISDEPANPLVAGANDSCSDSVNQVCLINSCVCEIAVALYPIYIRTQDQKSCLQTVRLMMKVISGF